MGGIPTPAAATAIAQAAQAIEPRYEWKSWSERDVYAMCGMVDLWDRAEAGEVLPALIRNRLRIAEELMRPRLQEIAQEIFATGTPGAGGLALLVGDE